MDFFLLQAIGVALGLFVGFVLSLTGAGGAILSVPLLVFCLHLKVVEAAPIGLLAVSMAAGLAALLGLEAGIVRYRAAILLAGCGMICAPAGVWLAHHTEDRVLKSIFVAVLMYVAARAYAQGNDASRASSGEAERACRLDPREGRLSWSTPCAWALAWSGALAGFFSGLLGVGGGFIIVPALRKVSDLELRSIVATSLTATALLSAGAAGVFVATGNMGWSLALPFATGSALGMLAGRRIAQRMARARMQQAFAILAFSIASATVVKMLTG